MTPTNLTGLTPIPSVGTTNPLSSLDSLQTLFSIIGLILAIFTLAGLWKTFEKAGKPGWAAIIPIYNIIVYLEIVEKPLYWIAIILAAPVVMIILFVIFSLIIGKIFMSGLTSGTISPAAMIIPGIIYFLGIIGSAAYLLIHTILSIEMGLHFKKSVTWSAYMLILFPYVGYFMLGFGKDQYNGPVTNSIANTSPDSPSSPTSSDTPTGISSSTSDENDLSMSMPRIPQPTEDTDSAEKSDTQTAEAAPSVSESSASTINDSESSTHTPTPDHTSPPTYRNIE